MREQLVGLKVTREEMQRLKLAAQPERLSTWLRSVIFPAAAAKLEDSGPAAPPSAPGNGSTGRAAASPAEGDPSGVPVPEPLLWADLWAEMERMEPGEAADRFRELAAGRKLPDGFRGWARAVKIAWLEREWEISCG